ncbi:MAG: serine/threonine protein kinase [Acidobacteria bacterium]|nr:serine/threonine protein kinase [Acidobacteriota bacterium]
MPEIGQTISHYRIIEKLGGGGMGVVYRARDLHLDRFVALKILPPEKVADAERKRRFVQEAKAASAINHPNIITIHDITQENGTDCIVMEYVEGQTLDQRIGHRGMCLNDALKCAVQIADALAKAHAAGIVHRDLKPTNIMVNESGEVKVLDFGLAKLTEQVQADESASTATVEDAGRPITEEGVIVGTVAYMSPEQAEGKKVDARSDIFSLGSVLYEMVTGEKAFDGKSRMSTLSAILREEPKPVSSITPAVPAELERLINRCLRKDPAKRFQHMDDVKVALDELKEESDSGKLAAIPAAGLKRSLQWLWGVAAAVTLALGALTIWQLQKAPLPNDLMPIALTSYLGAESQPSFSPDGNKVAFVWNGEKEDNFDIYIKQIGSAGTPMRLTANPAEERFAAWSPDDRYIAFTRVQQGNAAVILIPPLGGPEQILTEATTVSGISWTPDGKWLVAGVQDSMEEPLSIWAISTETRERRRLTSYPIKSELAETLLGDQNPSISPDGGSLAFARATNSYMYELYVLRLTRDLRPVGEPRLLTDQRCATLPGIAWTANGREIVYSAGGAQIQYLWRVPVTGRQAPKRLPYAQPATVFPAIARTPPRLAYSWQVLNMNLWRLDTRTGERRTHIASTYDSRLPDYSPDGRKIAFQSNRSGNVEVWSCDADGSNCAQLTSFNGPQCGSPRWSPDSRWLALDSRSEGQSEIYVMAADGGKPRRVTNRSADDIMPSWSWDGRWLYFSSNHSGQHELWKVPKDGGEPVQITRSGGGRSHASPDGRYIYYSKLSQRGLFRIPADGGEEEGVVPAEATGQGWTFDVTEKGVYFIAPDGMTIQLLDIGKRKLSTVVTNDKEIWGFTISPDGAFVVCGRRDRNTQDLMLVENFR